MPYAVRTSVPVDRTKTEIERLVVEKHGATQYMTGTKFEDKRTHAVVQFQMRNRYIRFDLPLPQDQQQQRARWRALLLIIKAKLEAVEHNVTTFEEEFLAHIVMPDGKTVGQHAVPQIAGAYATAKMPRLLPEYIAVEPAKK